MSGHLRRLLGPVGLAEFVRDYFQAKPLVVRGRPGKFDFLFRQEQFLLGLDRATEIRAVFPGLWQASIHPADIPEMVRAGATICVTGMEHAHPRLGRMARSIRNELGYSGRVSFRAYLSPPGSGFDVHYDARTATTLQIAGTKRWWYTEVPPRRAPERNSPRPAGRNAPGPGEMKSLLLRPGDLLCLPAGCWHRARAGTTSLALNLAFDHAGAGVLDVLLAALDARLRQDPAWRQPVPPMPPGPSALPGAAAEELRHRATLLQEELGRMTGSDAALRRALRTAARRLAEP